MIVVNRDTRGTWPALWVYFGAMVGFEIEPAAILGAGVGIPLWRSTIMTMRVVVVRQGGPWLFSCDYLCGVPIKGYFSATTWSRVDLYDRDAGEGMGQRVVDLLRQKKNDK